MALLALRMFLCLLFVFSSASAWLGINPQRNDGQIDESNNQLATPRPVAQKLNILTMPDRMLAMKAYLDTANLPQTPYQRKINLAFLQAMAKMLGKTQIVEVDSDDIGSWSSSNA
ncbi:uncharacterized protein LOC129599401 isoform X2 [Paramacrobiotus metropolitanus]|uniref:uncharacterized protein LOC129599401 isoform X2 n=1 Tax=Paramacrobiotus metropolitanus TaxID=2943436 RepID=UPI00244608A2|nr:uncharacterized protein LOC129599401 isoform X2 [Paramacrobiotus metropolitanus]